MALQVSATELRDELTELWHGISYGQFVVVQGAGRSPVLLRPLRSGDRGQRIPITSFRRKLHRILREVQREPRIVTVGGDPYFWVGPAPDRLPESPEDWRERLQWATDHW